MIWCTQIRRSLTIVLIPVVAALMAVSINSPSDAWREAWDGASGHISELSVLIDVVVALLAAWEAGRFRRSGLSRLESSVLRSEFPRLVGVIASSALFGVATLTVVALYMSRYVVGGGHPWIEVFAEDVAAIVTFATFGTAIGTWWTSRLAAPVTAVAAFGWLVYGGTALESGRPQSLFPAALTGTNCCAFNYSIVGRSLAATLGWQFGLAGGLLILILLRTLQRKGTTAWLQQGLIGGVAIALALAGATLVAVDGGNPTSAIRAPMAQRCLHLPDGYGVCDYTQMAYMLPLYRNGINAAKSQLPPSWLPHHFVPLPSSRLLTVSRGTGYIAGGAIESWTQSTTNFAVGIATSYFHLMMACRSGLHGQQLQTLQRDTELAGFLITSRVNGAKPGPKPQGIPYPDSLTWAQWSTQSRFIDATLARIWRCRAEYLN